MLWGGGGGGGLGTQSHPLVGGGGTFDPEASHLEGVAIPLMSLDAETKSARLETELLVKNVLRFQLIHLNFVVTFRLVWITTWLSPLYR